MKNRSRIVPLILIVLGLLDAAALQVVLRVPHPPILETDLVQGIWLGASIGLEIVGLALLLKNKSRLPG